MMEAIEAVAPETEVVVRRTRRQFTAEYGE
jgi:hypothetical protein